MDYGYDAYIMDNLSNDMFFLIGTSKFVIQGVGTFDKNASYPIGVKTDAEGTVKFMIDDLENFEANQPVYIYDSETNTYNNIRGNTYAVNLVAGTNTTRFSLRFFNPAVDTIIEVPEPQPEPEKPVEPETVYNITITHIQKTDIININNEIEDCSVTKVRLYNDSGIEVQNWKIQDNRDQSNIQVHFKKTKIGVYIVKVETTKGEFTKKILVE